MIQSATQESTTMAMSASTMMVSPKQQYSSPVEYAEDSAVTAAAHSNMASQAIAEGNYPKALEFYQLALDEYLKGSPTVVELVNAAATCFNLGALSKKLQSYQQASDYFCKAEELYKTCTQQVLQATGEQPDAEDADNISDVCLFQLVVETLQARAHLHYKYQGWLDGAIECHEEVIDVLEQQIKDDHALFYCKVKFTMLSRDDRWQLLVTSLQSLGKFYVEKGAFEDGLVAYQEALSTLREQQTSGVQTQQRQDEIKQIIKALSEIYMKSNDTSVRVPELQKFAELQEELANWDNALSCWERVLYLQSQEHGEESIEVAGTLCHVARIMLAQENSEGALDLYKAAAMKFHLIGTPLTRDLLGNTVDIFCHLSLHEQALRWLDACLERAHSVSEEAFVWCQKGRVFLDQGKLDEASRSLCMSAEQYEGDDMYVFQLLQKLEFLQHRSDSVDPVLDDPAVYQELGLDSIREDDESSGPSQDIGSHGSGDRNMVQHEAGHTGGVGVQTALDVLEEETPETLEETGNILKISIPGPSGSRDNSLHSTSNVAHERDNEEGDLVPSDEGESHEDVDSIFDEMPLSPQHHEDKQIIESGILLEGNMFPGTKAKTGREDGSRSTEVTELSMETGERSPNKGDLVSQSPSQPSSPALLHQIPDPMPSNDGTDSESGFYFRGSADRDETEARDEPISTQNFAHAQNGASQSPSNIDTSSQAVPKKTMAPSLDMRLKRDTNRNDQASDQVIQGPRSSGESDERDSPATVPSHSRIGLLQNEEKAVSHSKSMKMPSLPSPKSPRSTERSEYVEISKLQNQKAAPRNRLVKALSSPFRRTRSAGKKPNPANDLDALDEDREVRGQLPDNVIDPEDDISESALDAPVSFISMGDDDDDQSQVSQITFKIEEPSKRKSNQDSQWWWGVTDKGLEGWFPSSYVHQAVEAAEGFLSAKAIHEQVKSRPLDFDSDDESDNENGKNELVDGTERESSDPSEERPSTSSQGKNEDKPATITRNASPESSLRPNSSTAALGGTARSVASKKTTLSAEIAEKITAYEEKTAAVGSDDIAVATILFELAALRYKNNQEVEALRDAQQALKIQKATLNMVDACKTLNLMADMHSRGRQYKAALACYSEAQHLQVAVFGYFHEEVAATKNRIGNVLARQGEFDLAMDNHKEALRILKECCGEEVNNPAVSHTLIQIGAVYYKERNSLTTIQKNTDGYTTFIEGGMLEVIGRAHEERGSYRMAIAFFEEKLQFLNEGDNSKDLEQVAETLNSLGMLSCRAGLYLEAIEYYDKALNIQKKLGCDDVQLAMARVLAGSVQYALGQFDKALKLFEDALNTLKDKIGEERETVAATLFHMGVVRVALCDFDNAMSDLQEALKTQKKLLGNEHPATLRTRREIGNLFAVYESELDSAFHEYDAVLAAQTRIHGGKHPNVAETLHSIGKAQASKGDHGSALQTLEKCYNMRLEFLGMDHPLQATTLCEIAKIQLKRGRVKKALHICESALHIRKESLSENHVDVASTLALRGSCLVVQSNFAEASKTFLEAQTIAVEAVGANHPTVADIHVQMGIMHLRQCHFEEASEAITKALNIYRKSDLDEDFPGIKEAKLELERIERAEMLCV